MRIRMEPRWNPPADRSLARYRREAVPRHGPPAWRALVVVPPPAPGSLRAFSLENRARPERDLALLRGLRRLSLPALVAVALVAGHGVGALGERTVAVRIPAPTKQPVFTPAPAREPHNVWSPALRPAPHQAL